MKKIILSLAFAVLAFAANAQLVVSGSIGYSTTRGLDHATIVNGTTTTEYKLPDNYTTTFTFAPTVGYQLNDKVQVGISFGYSHTAYTQYMSTGYSADINFEGWGRSSWNIISIAPYVRYNIAELGKFTLFAVAQLGFGFTPHIKYHEYNTAVASIGLDAADTVTFGNIKENSISLSIVPGLNYRLTDKISVDLYIDLLGLSYTHNKEVSFVDRSASYGSTYTREEVITSSSFNVGANLGAQTLTNHLSLFRLGFNYHF